ncbi:MAG: flagellar motor switch phosphatase FliY [Limnochordia bacterium]|jgi:flagellar motor switch protein FliN/FliY
MQDELLSQEEIDRLLREDSNEEAKTSAEEFTAEEQDALAEIGNISMGSAATALSNLVKKRVQITVPKVQLMRLADLQAAYPVPCVIVNVRYVKGLQGENLLIIKESDAITIASLMMGLDEPEPGAQLDELSLSAIAEAMNQMMGSAATAMSELFGDVIDLSPPQLEYQLLAEKTAETPPDRAVVSVSFRIEIEDLIDSEMVQLIELKFAKDMVSRLLPETEVVLPVQEETQPEPMMMPTIEEPPPITSWEPEPVATTLVDNLNIELIKNIPVQIRAILGRTKMSINNVLKLGPGHVMELDTMEGEPIDVLVNDTLVARGEVVVVGENFGIRITEIASPAQRIDSLR